MLLHPVGDPVQDQRRARPARCVPHVSLAAWAASSASSMSSAVERATSQKLGAGDRGRVVEVLAVDRRDPLAADEVVVASAQRERGVYFVESLMQHCQILPKGVVMSE